MFYSRPPKTSHLPVVSYCFLCRKNLVPISGNSSSPQSWELNLVAIPEPPPKRRVLRVTLETHTRGTDDRLILDGAKVKVCDVPAKACAPCHDGRSVYVAHRDCWNLAVVAGKTHIGLYRFAANLQHVIPPRYSAQPPPYASFYPDVVKTTELGRLVHTGAMRLPAEIQHKAIEYLGDHHLVSSLFRASQTMASHVKETPLYQAVEHVTLGPPTHISSLCIKTGSIFGLAYLSDIGFNQREGDFIDVRDIGFIGVRFALGTYGIRGLRILYEDGSMSRWLGDSRFSWFGEVYGYDLRNLSVFRDELRILKVVFEKGYCELGPGTLAMGLWSHEVALSRDLVHSVAAPDYDRGHPVFYEDWDLHGYLQLGGDDWYASGITVYCQENSISGILSHSGRTNTIGVSDGLPIYFALRHDERITGLWVITHTPEQQGASYQAPTTGPCLLIATNLGRTKYFGRHGLTTPHPRQWTPLVRRGSIAMGLYFDGSSSVCATAVPSGVPSRFNKLRTSARLRPPSSHLPGKGVVFVSYAMLTATRSLKVCMEGDVYTGLLIVYYNGTSETLGCWDASGKSPIRTIYGVGDGPLMRLAFRLGERQGVTRVVEITPVVGDASIPDGDDVTVCVFNIVWWFGTLGDNISNREWITRDMPTDALPIPVHRARPGSEAWLMGSSDL